MTAGRPAARESETTRRRSIWGVVLLIGAALAVTGYCTLDGAYWAARREHQVLFVGAPLDSLAAWFLVVAVPVGAAGLLLVLPVLIVRYKWARTAAELSGWPRVIDQVCQLDAAEAGLRLVCGDKTVEIDVQEPAM